MNLMVFNFLSIVHYSITLPHRRVMLLCAGILGRYYTDTHDVDEDKMTHAHLGGMWVYENQAGIMLRHVFDSPTYRVDTVASQCRHLRNL